MPEGLPIPHFEYNASKFSGNMSILATLFKVGIPRFPKRKVQTILQAVRILLTRWEVCRMRYRAPYGASKGRPSLPNCLFFFNIVQTAFDAPLPLVLNIYVADFSIDYCQKASMY